jgi:hypothetical protein
MQERKDIERPVELHLQALRVTAAGFEICKSRSGDIKCINKMHKQDFPDANGERQLNRNERMHAARERGNRCDYRTIERSSTYHRVRIRDSRLAVVAPSSPSPCPSPRG